MKKRKNWFQIQKNQWKEALRHKNMREEFKIYAENLLQINLEINSLLNSLEINSGEGYINFEKFTSSFENLLKEKNQIIEKISKLKTISEEEFQTLKENEFKEIWKKINSFEQENLILLSTNQGNLSYELKVQKNYLNAVSSYKFQKDYGPRLVDDDV